jgi:hypothetical protein
MEDPLSGAYRGDIPRGIWGPRVLYEILIIDAMVCAILGGLIAQSKGRSGAEGVFVGALLGLLGLLLIVLAPSKAVLAPATVANPSLRPCPRCAEPIQQAAILCRFCGSEIAAAGDLAVTAVEPTTAVAPVEAPSEPAAAPVAPRSGRSGLLKAGVVLLVVAVIAGAVFVMQQRMDQIDSSYPWSTSGSATHSEPSIAGWHYAISATTCNDFSNVMTPSQQLDAIEWLLATLRRNDNPSATGGTDQQVLSFSRSLLTVCQGSTSMVETAASRAYHDNSSVHP